MKENLTPEQLIKRYVDGTATPEEKALVESWHLEDLRNSSEAPTMPEINEVHEQMRETILAHASQRQRRIWPRFAAAASVLLALGIGTYYIARKKEQPQAITHNKIQYDILPGGNKAYLTLGNGQKISLTDAENGTIASQGGKTIQKTADGSIKYDSSHSFHNSAEVVYNTIETPRGGQYQITLPDGSKVWLNAASSLKYPAEFTGDDRKVQLTGEAYFEVSKDKAHPFKVATDKQIVEVLGTHFNINSYTDEPGLKTTLLEGSVKITAGSTERIIKPGEQAVFKGENLKVQEADEEEVLAWKNGLFVFNDESLESIMRKVSRWYDVDVQYANVDKTQTFWGGVPRFSSVSKLLMQLESTRLVHFKIEGKVIYVTK